MEEILKLQQELAAVQETSTKHRLSERNCVELVQTLHSLQLTKLIFTRSGKEYLTHERLIEEVRAALDAHDGRLNLTDLVDIVNVSLPTIESIALPTILTPGSGVRVVQGELLTEGYLRAMIDDINESLRQSVTGIDSVIAIASRTALPVDLVRESLVRHIDALHARFNESSGEVVSDKAVRRMNAVARGRLTGSLYAVRPIADATEEAVAQDMLRNGDLSGRIEVSAGTKIFVPAVLERAALESLVSAFRVDGFVPIDELARTLYTSRAGVEPLARAHLGTDVVIMKTAIVSEQLLDRVATGAEEAVRGGSWMDVSASIPPSFPVHNDLALLVGIVAQRAEQALTKEGQDETNDSTLAEAVERDVIAETDEHELGNELSHPTKKKNGKVRKGAKGKTKRRDRRQKTAQALDERKISSCIIPVIADRFIASPALLGTLRNTVFADAQVRADERAKTLAQKMETVGGQGSVANQQGESETIVGSKKGKDKGRKRTTNAESTSITTNNYPADIAVPNSIEITADIILKDAACSELLRSDFFEEAEVQADGDDFEGSSAEQLVQAFVDVELHEQLIRDMYTRKAHEAVETLARETKEAAQRTEKDIVSLLLHAEYFDKAAATLPSDSLVASSRQSIRSSVCLDLLCCVTSAIASMHGVHHDSITSGGKLAFVESIAEQLPPLIRSRLEDLKDAVVNEQSESIPTMLQVYDAMSNMLDLPTWQPMNAESETSLAATLQSEILHKLHAQEIEIDTDAEPLSGRDVLMMVAVLTHARSKCGSVVRLDTADLEEFCFFTENEQFVQFKSRLFSDNLVGNQFKTFDREVKKELAAMLETLTTKSPQVFAELQSSSQ